MALLYIPKFTFRVIKSASVQVLVAEQLRSLISNHKY